MIFDFTCFKIMKNNNKLISKQNHNHEVTVNFKSIIQNHKKWLQIMISIHLIWSGN